MVVLRVVAVGALAGLLLLLESGCARNTPILAPTDVVVGGVVGGELATASEGPDYGGTWKAKEEVEVEWHGSWWPALILEKRGGHWLVHYEGYGAEWDEVVGGDRIRERRAEPQIESNPEVDDEPDP